MLDLGPRKGRGGFQWRRSAAPGGGHWSSSSGEVGAGEKGWSGSVATVGARGGKEYRSWAMQLMELELAMAVLTGTGGRLGPGRQGVRP
jgi:hypothetical protein